MTSSGICDANGLKIGDWTHQISIKSILDGTSNTMLAGELHIPDGQLNTIPYNGPIFNGQELDSHTRLGGPGVPLLTGKDEAIGIFGFGSDHPGITNFVFADGSTSSVSNRLDSVTLGRMCHREDGQITNREK